MSKSQKELRKTSRTSKVKKISALSVQKYPKARAALLGTRMRSPIDTQEECERTQRVRMSGADGHPDCTSRVL